MKIAHLGSLVLASVALFVSATGMQAAVVLSPEAVLANTYGEYSSTYRVENIINQAGMSPGSEFVSGVTEYETYVGSAPTHSSNNGAGASSWFGVNVPPQEGHIDFDLGNLYHVETLAFFSNPYRAFTSITVYASDGEDFLSLTELGSFTPYYSGELEEEAILQNIDLLDTNTRYIRFSMDGYYSILPSIGEVAFGVDVAVVPEPSIYALLAGAVALGLVAARRRS